MATASAAVRASLKGRTGGALEVPETIPGLKAWYDSRDASHFALGAGGEVSAWLSRAGSLGAIWTQGSAANQPIRVPSSSFFGGLPAVRLDGVNDSLVTSNKDAWTFLHNGSGQSTFRVYRLDSTGIVNQMALSSEAAATHFGITDFSASGSLTIRFSNGSVRETWTLNNVAHSSRDVTRWHMIGLDAANLYSRASGSSLSDPNVQAPGAGVPSVALRLGNGTANAFKGLWAQDIYYDHVLTAGETAQLATWAADTYGVDA
jgi:hypothetical protein